MQHIAILAVGRLKEKYLTVGVGEYLKRVSPYAKVALYEVEDEGIPDNPSPDARRKVREKEGARLLNHLRPGTFLVALDKNGESRSSEEMAALLDELALAGRNDLTFVIGGSLGLSPEIVRRADLRLSFSQLTFPHQLFRLILLEQLYRWFKISRSEPYHK
ncbi:23S rRNA (pseudouridine(1915)-N(3))-methyltransferase RlmH [Pelotomaculum terephthalicicum JT]|uniref:23S rRNA (pseudouridine(1915)-N(3))-methyltransferase RlmH n=1 Tax=Pelotomaculum TaxID=191373 RepID=UPI0009D04721|nr:MULTISPECIES: 23S rRNA (pseudouridine(1915)-N(3))-methyltransferase RlmH [Pelotomaculum]MCG9968337.1 23S rRNA (pseudouridine(1915)-N(3))-methyltransferase RlmH [Pelotomaculum terephthalicicum JT]OPX87553.1 MAG: Ribosomal RNA large subunit methyltransferase H [Pelotomaculum sp. PtaB.Bin117]OPY60787.1 MAG: Ribosomal RNA large subunit methyltransferase H [Pelotomaculum sp. PtaU1.Bin065]